MLTTTPQLAPSDGLRGQLEVHTLGAVVALVAISGGTLLAAVDLRFGFVGAAVVLGWTQLVGL